MSFVPDPLDFPALSFVLLDEFDFCAGGLEFLNFLVFFFRTTLLPLEFFPCEMFEFPLGLEPFEFPFPLLGFDVEGDPETFPELPLVWGVVIAARDSTLVSSLDLTLSNSTLGLKKKGKLMDECEKGSLFTV